MDCIQFNYQAFDAFISLDPCDKCGYLTTLDMIWKVHLTECYFEFLYLPSKSPILPSSQVTESKHFQTLFTCFFKILSGAGFPPSTVFKSLDPTLRKTNTARKALQSRWDSEIVGFASAMWSYQWAHVQNTCMLLVPFLYILVTDRHHKCHPQLHEGKSLFQI